MGKLCGKLYTTPLMQNDGVPFDTQWDYESLLDWQNSLQIPVGNVTIERGIALAETTEMGDRAETYAGTVLNGSISFDGLWNPAKEAHTMLVSRIRAGEEVEVTFALFNPRGTGAIMGIWGTFIQDKFTRKTGKKDMLGFSASGKFSGYESMLIRGKD
jgi:hypothetical protein